MSNNFNFLTPDQVREQSTDSRITTLYGPSGVGKSSLALTASKTNRILYIDLEGVYGQIVEAISDLIDEKNITAWRPTSIRQVIELVCSPDVRNFDLTIIDSASFLTENQFVEERGDYKDPRKLYGNLIDDFAELLKEIQQRSLNVLILCHSSEAKDEETGVDMHYPTTKTKKLTQGMMNRSTNIIFMETVQVKDESGERKNVYRLHCDRFSMYAKGKKRDSRIPNLIEKDVVVWQDIEQYFSKIEKSKITPANLKKVQKLIKDGNELAPLNMETLFSNCGVPVMDLADLSVTQAQAMIDLLTARNAHKAEAKKITEQAKK